MLLFGVLVAVHEFGHFMTAKLSGVRVNEFAIGMGPAIFKKQLGETLYSLRILPFGGYCAMEGEDSASEDPRAFGSRPVFYRILIVLAGSVMNLVMGFVVLSLVFAPIKQWYTPTIASIEAEAEIPDNSLRAGDTIREIDGYNIYIYSDIFVGISRGGKDGTYDVKVLRDGKETTLENIKFSSDDKGSDSGYRINFAVEDMSLLGKARYVAQNGINLVRLVKVGLVDLVTGAVSRDDLSGPVGIGKMMADTAKTSMSSLWYLFAFISINLGVMNLLPFPALDGGRFVFLLFELVFRKPVSPKVEGFIHAAGLALLMVLMIFVTYNDIIKLFAR